jgi:hypothetical protein
MKKLFYFLLVEYESLNQHHWLTHRLFLRKDYEECLKHMADTETESCDLSIRIKGNVWRIGPTVFLVVKLKFYLFKTVK